MPAQEEYIFTLLRPLPPSGQPHESDKNTLWLRRQGRPGPKEKETSTLLFFFFTISKCSFLALNRQNNPPPLSSHQCHSPSDQKDLHATTIRQTESKKGYCSFFHACSQLQVPPYIFLGQYDHHLQRQQRQSSVHQFKPMQSKRNPTRRTSPSFETRVACGTSHSHMCTVTTSSCGQGGGSSRRRRNCSCKESQLWQNNVGFICWHWFRRSTNNNPKNIDTVVQCHFKRNKCHHAAKIKPSSNR